MQKELVILLLLLVPSVLAECQEAVDGQSINESVAFCSDTFDIPSGISITSSNIVVDCRTAVLRGVLGESEIGLRLENVDNVTIRNCNIATFNQGMYLHNVTNSLIEKNAFLKNRIGVRLFESYENTIKDNSDKSYQIAVSAISSRFNVVMLGNKEIERSFCQFNACNEEKEMDVCVAGDFYCSKRCSPATDADCGKVLPSEVEDKMTAGAVAQTSDEFPLPRPSAQPNVEDKLTPAPPWVAPLIALFIVVLLIAGIFSVKRR